MSIVKFRTTNFSSSYRESYSRSIHPTGIYGINSVAYNGEYWLIGGLEGIKTLLISTYPGVMANLKKSYEFKSLADSIEVQNGSKSLIEFNRQSSDNFKNFCDREYALQKELKKSETFFTAYTTHTMAISYDGRSWNLIDSNPFAYNNYIPHSTYSENGVAVQQYDLTGGIRPRCNGIAWTGDMWVAVGSTRNIATEIDFQLRYWDGMKFKTRDSQNLSCIATSTDGLNWTQQPFFRLELYCVATGSNRIVVGGPQLSDPGNDYSCLATSTDGKTWSIISSQTPIRICRGIAYNGNMWVAVGEGGLSGSDNLICTSSNGTTWIGRLGRNGTSRNFKAVAWNGEKWLAVGNKTNNSDSIGIIATSTNGTSWTVEDFSTQLNTVSWNGSQWVIGGNDGVFTSLDGVYWSFVPETDDKLILSSASTVVLPLTQFNTETINSLLVGNGNPSSIYVSSDSINWEQRTPNILRNNQATKPLITVKNVIWDGTQWIISGSFNLIDSFYKSTDANDWTGVSLSSTSSNNTVDIAYNGSLYVAITDSIYSSSQIYTSTNSTTWTSRTSTLKGLCIAYNSNRWVIGGDGGIQYSSNGTSWTKSTTCPLTKVNKIVWNGYVWIAVGSGPTSSIVASIDGIRWYLVKSAVSNLFSEGTSVVWNKSIWVAFGKGNANTIATSVDGYNWIGRGNSVFGDTAHFVSWNGTNFLGFGEASLPYVTSTNGINWTNSSIGLTSINGFFDKTISMPITGVSNDSLLTEINAAVSEITTLTNATIVAEEAAAAFAADQAAQAALQAQKTTSINNISLKRIHILYWNYRISNEFTPLTSSDYIDLKLEYPYEFYLCEDLRNDVQEFVNEMEPLYSRLSPTYPTDEFDRIIHFIDERHAELFQRLPEYYNNCRILYTNLIDAIYSAVTLESISDIIENWGFTTQVKNRLIAFYDLKKDAYNTLVTDAKNTINTDLTSIDMTYSTNVNDYSVQGVYEGFNFTPSMFVVNNSDFVNKSVTGSITKSIPFGGGFITVIASIRKLLKPSGGDILEIYNSVAKITDDNSSVSLTQTFETDDSNALLYLTLRKRAFETMKPIKDKCDEYYEKSAIEAQKWLTVVNVTVDQEELDADFDPLYSRYFYEIDGDRPLGGFMVPSSYVPIGQYTADYKYAERLFEIMFDKYGNISLYPTVSETIRAVYLEKDNQVKNLIAAADVYSSNKRRDFYNKKISVRPSIYVYTFSKSEIEEYTDDFHRNRFSGPNSLYSKLVVGYEMLGRIIEHGEETQNLITNIKLADIAAEEDGAKPPFTGWGGPMTVISENPTVSVLGGSQGRSGWEKFNNTGTTRALLADKLGRMFGFSASRDVNNKAVPFYIDYLTNATADTVITLRNQIVEQFDAYLDDNMFETEYIDTLVTNSDSLLASEYKTQAKPILQGIRDRLILEDLPSNSDLTNYGYLTILNTTLAQYVNNLFGTIAIIDGALEQDITNLTTFSQVQSYVTGILSSIDSVQASVRAPQYTSLLSRINQSKQYSNRILSLQNSFSNTIARIDRVVNNVLNNPPYPIGELATEYGNDFIVSVNPTNVYYWEERKATVVLDPASNGFLEATLNNSTGQYKIVDPLNVDDYTSYSSTADYVKYDRVKFDNKIYECIKDNTNTSSSTIKGVEPSVTSRWKQIEYPYVEYLGDIVEAKPENLSRLVSTEFSEYDATLKYRKGSYVSNEGKVFYCIRDFTQNRKIKGVSPTNTVYWQETVYPRVTYADRFNFATVEGSPTNLIQFDPDDYALVNNQKRYYKDDVVSHLNNNGQKRVYKCIATNPEGVLVEDTSIISINPQWERLTYPYVYYNGNVVFAGTDPFPIPPLDITTISTYDANTEYETEALVKLNGKIYYCLISTGIDIQNISTTNTNFWKEITFPIVKYNSNEVEAIPFSISKLVVSEFEAYDSTTSYVKNDKVAYNGLIYECYFDEPLELPIRNINPTNTNNWIERRYNVLYDIYGNEIEPTPDKLKALNPLDYHEYDNNFLYYYGDLTSYNSKVYQCVNVEPPDLTPLEVSNVDVSDTDTWQKQDTTLQTLEIYEWNNFSGYSAGTIVTFGRQFYRCERTHSRTSVNPFVNVSVWANIPEVVAIPNAKEFSLSDPYVIGDIVFRLRYDEEDTFADFYKCINTTPDSLVEYEYAEFTVGDEIGSDGYEKYNINNKTWSTNNLPRHGTGFVVDPFRIPHFAWKLRRRVMMNIELPLEKGFKLALEVEDQLRGISTEAINLNQLVTPANNPNIFINARATLTNLLRQYDAIATEGGDGFTKILPRLLLHAYGNVYDQLRQIKDTILSYRSAVNVMKMQYFTNPYLQNLIYKDPYPFLNYVAAASNPPKQQFKDLGVGDIDEINYELDVKRSQLKWTPAARDYYNARQPIIDDYDEKITQLVVLAKYLIGYPVAFQMDNSDSKMGATIYCDSVRFLGLGIPICGYEDLSYVNGRGSSDNIFRLIHEIMTEAVRPPSYVTDTNLATALTWESANPTIKGLGSVAKGLVGLTAAAFENFTSPTAVFDLVELAGQVCRWDFETKILTFVPEIRYPNFRDLAENRVLFKQAVRIQQRVNSDPLREEEINEIRTTVRRLNALLLLAKLDLRGIRSQTDAVPISSRVTDTLPPAIPDIPVPVPTTPVAPPSAPREVLIPPTPPKPIVPGPPPRKPQTLKLICLRNLQGEILALKKQIEDLESLVTIQTKVPRKVPLPTDISSNVVQDAKTTGVTNFKFPVDRNGYLHRGTGDFRVGGSAGQVDPFRFVNGGNPSGITKAVNKNTAAIKDGFDKIRSQNEQIVYDTISEEKRKGTDAEIESAKRELASRESALSAGELENEARRAANSEAMKTYREDLQRSAQELRESKIRNAENQIEYEAQKKQFEARQTAITAQERAEFEAKRNKFIESRNQVASRELVFTQKRVAFEEALLEEPGFKGLINTKLGLAIRAKYAGAISSIVNSAAYTTIARSYRRGIVAVANTKVARQVAKVGKKLPFRTNMIGPMAEIAGIGLLAWQNGAFSDD